MKKYIWLLCVLLLWIDTQAQTKIKAWEYWFDENHANAKTQTIGPSEEIQINENIDISGLSDYGLHTLHVRFIDENNNWSSATSRFFTYFPGSGTPVMQEIVGFEYWFDSNNDDAVSTVVSNSSYFSLDQSLNVSGLEFGLHTVHFRFKDKNGVWSPVASRFFTYFLGSGTPVIQEIVGFEYWFDSTSDEAVSTAVSNSADFSLDQSLNVSSLEFGLHTVHFRFKDKKGVWSPVASRFFTYFLGSGTPVVQKINQFEYWFDDQIDESVSTDVAETENLNISDVLDVAALNYGLHTIHYRFRNDKGSWSSVASRFFSFFPNSGSPELKKLTQIEYWIDTKFENATTEDISATGFLNLEKMIDVSALNSGLHTFHFRVKDSKNEWSPVISRFFSNFDDSKTYADNQVITFRHWVDSDLNSLQSEVVSGTSGVYILDKVVDTGQLVSGQHFMNVQFQDKAGKWSSASGAAFEVEPTPTAVLSASVLVTCPAEGVLFTSEITDVDEISWNFGDGESSVEFNPTHAYANPGEYSVSATVSYTASGKSNSFDLEGNIVVKQTYQETDEVTICSSELPFLFGTQSLTTAGEYTEVFSSEFGCDSTVTLTLNVNPSYHVLYSASQQNQEYQINDDFESDTPGALPAGWLKMYNGTGDANQKVVNTIAHGGINSFQLEGQSSWSSEYYQTITGSPERLIVESWINVEKTLSGMTGGIGLGDKAIGSWGTRTSRLEFFGGRIRATYTGGALYDIQSYNPGEWYHIKMEHDLVLKVYSVYINGVKVNGTSGTTTSDIFPMHPTVNSKEVMLLAGNGGTVKLFFDEVKMYESSDVEICSSELPFIFGTQSITESGKYIETFSTVAGCDSTVVLNLNVKPSYNETVEKTVFSDDLPYLFGTQSLSLAGEYTEIFSSVLGCDSTVVLTLSVEISLESGDLESAIREIIFYPNPTNGLLQIKGPKELSDRFKLAVYSNSGSEVLRKEFEMTEFCTLDLSGFANGSYHIRIYSEKVEFRKKIILRK